jgi:hypothetical protein
LSYACTKRRKPIGELKLTGGRRMRKLSALWKMFDKRE